jgi:DNA repair protein RadA/Sms
VTKERIVFECQNCGGQFPKWSGQCGECGKWNSLVESVVNRGRAIGSRQQGTVEEVKAVEWRKVKSDKKLHGETGIGELDRVLGGGLVKGGVVLLAGEPGIGKSTMLSQLALRMNKVLYVNGEESQAQVSSRLRRLTTDSGSSKSVVLYPETNIERVLDEMRKSKWDLVIVDSIQVMYSEKLRGIPGGVGQIRECGQQLIRISKRLGLPVILVGHFTKTGEVAGPKVLEHMVDVVMILEGERSGGLRTLRSLKNRFGVTDEVGLFEMKDGGLAEVKDPTGLLMVEDNQGQAGRSVAIVMQGLRPLLIEVQALVVPTKLVMPRRVAQGINMKRLQVIAAVLKKYLKLRLGEMDVFVNITGGLQVTDPAVDLAVAVALVSSVKNRSVRKGVALAGEIGLLGEVRGSNFDQKRQKEAKRLKYRFVGADLKRVGSVSKLFT